MPITLKDVARAAGISDSRASLVLNNRHDIQISSITRKKVIAAAERLGYSPNPIARGLRTRKTQTIGVILPRITLPFYNELIQNIEIVTAQNKYSMLLGCSEFQKNGEEYYLKQMYDKSVEGIIIASTVKTNCRLISEISRKIPVVFSDSYPEKTEADYVVSDNYEGGYKAAEHLAKQEIKNICYIGSADLPVLQQRYAGFCGFFNENSCNHHKIFTIGNDNEMNKIYFFITEKQVNSLFFSSSRDLINALRQITAASADLSEKIKITGFDYPFYRLQNYEDFTMLKKITAPISYIEQPIYEIGRQAAEILFQRINGDKSAQKKILLKTRLIVN